MVAGFTFLLHVPLPNPVIVPPPLLNVSVQFPMAVIVPDTDVLTPLHILLFALVIIAVGRGFIVILISVPLFSQPDDSFLKNNVPVLVPTGKPEMEIALGGKVDHGWSLKVLQSILY